jgi:NitT/TauT family transport system substrate-binding protein
MNSLRAAFGPKLAALLLVLPLAACGGSGGASDDGGDITIRMGIIPTYNTFMPHFIAEGQGYFDELADQGIKLEMVPFQSGADETKALAAGQLDLASSMFTEASIPMSKGVPLELTMVYWSGGVSSMLVATKYQATTLDELREELGRPIKVGVTAFGSGTDVAARAQLNNLGMSEDDYEIVPIGGIAAYSPSLIQGRVDVVEAGEPDTQNLINVGAGRVLINGWDRATVDKVFGSFQANGLIGRADFIKEHPDSVQAVVDALYKALQFIQDHLSDPDAILKALPPEGQDAISEYQADVWPRISSVVSTDGCTSTEAAEAVQEAVAGAGLIEDDVDVDWSKYQTNQFLDDRCS